MAASSKALLALALFGACVVTGMAQEAAEVAPAACNSQLRAWDQCGGKSGCPGGNGCGDKPWDGACCPAGHSCVRNNDYYYNCQPGAQSGGGGGGNNNGGGGGGNNNGQPAGPGAYKPDPAVPARKVNGEYDYAQVLDLSFKFYEAQRSGKLPANNRVAWRADSGLDHKAPTDGRDVTGGWYDAGDNVKFNLPMAWSAAVIAWSVVDFADGYKKAGTYQTALDNVKWVTDYFIKAVGSGSDIVVQVGNGAQDHSVWGRPEDIKNPVPAYVITPSAPGSDVAGAMAAALAAASVAFKNAGNEAYSQQLLSAAVKAYNFGAKYQGKYSDSVPDAGAFYRSSNFKDDLAFAALWLHLRTGDASYKQQGYDWYMKHYNTEDGPGVWDNFDWDSNSWGAVVLLSRLFPNDATVNARITKFVDAWTKGSDLVKRTPKGLLYSGPWGSLRHVGNAMFLMEAYQAGNKALAANTRSAIQCSVKQQLGYILGDTGRSFVVGYGTNPPQRPHHRASSCPPLGVACTWDYFNNAGPNPHTLYGALVGGPGASDDYSDDRNDYIKNEVATDYNAGFTGALAAAAQGLARCNAGAQQTTTPRGGDAEAPKAEEQQQQQEQKPAVAAAPLGEINGFTWSPAYGRYIATTAAARSAVHKHLFAASEASAKRMWTQAQAANQQRAQRAAAQQAAAADADAAAPKSL